MKTNKCDVNKNAISKVVENESTKEEIYDDYLHTKYQEETEVKEFMEQDNDFNKGIIYDEKIVTEKFKKDVEVYVPETRPLLQGARLNTWELERSEIPYKLITDSMAGSVMRDKKIDLVIVGADRIAKNGDAANKIGTYNLAVLAMYHDIPFYVAAPDSTVDRNIESGEDIPIEERAADEISSYTDKVYNPAFDVTPFELIDTIITEKGYWK